MESAALEAAKSYQSEEQLAEELGVKVSTLRRWHSLRTGPPRTKVGRRILYDRQLVADFIKLNAVMVTRKKKT